MSYWKWFVNASVPSGYKLDQLEEMSLLSK